MKKITSLVLSALFSAVLLSCSLLTQTKNTAIIVNLPCGKARAGVSAPDYIKYYRVEAECVALNYREASDVVMGQKDYVEFTDLDEGEYTVTVSAWATALDGADVCIASGTDTVTVKAGKTVAADIRLTVPKITIEYDSTEYNEVPDSVVRVMTSVDSYTLTAEDLPVVERAGYAFEGWSLWPAGGEAYLGVGDTVTPEDGKITLYPTWHQIMAEVTVEVDNNVTLPFTMTLSDNQLTFTFESEKAANAAAIYIDDVKATATVNNATAAVELTGKAGKTYEIMVILDGKSYFDTVTTEDDTAAVTVGGSGQ